MGDGRRRDETGAEDAGETKERARPTLTMRGTRGDTCREGMGDDRKARPTLTMRGAYCSSWDDKNVYAVPGVVGEGAAQGERRRGEGAAQGDDKNVYVVPFRPARPVRPTRCT